MSTSPSPAVGKTSVVSPVIARVTLSTKKRTQAPGIVVARARGAEALGVRYEATRARIVAQRGGHWMTWEVTA